jgi:hypothetical protein
MHRGLQVLQQISSHSPEGEECLGVVEMCSILSHNEHRRDGLGLPICIKVRFCAGTADEAMPCLGDLRC